MKHTLSHLAMVLMMSIAGAAVAQQAESAASGFSGKVAKVNGVAIPSALGNAFLKEQVTQGALDSPDLRTRVRDHLVRREVLLQEARKEKVDKGAELIQRIAYMRDEMVINAYLDSWSSKHPVADTEVRAEYDRAVAALGSGSEYKVRHILVEKEEEAKALITNLQSGIGFAELAVYSKDSGSKENGGDLGWSDPSVFVKEFSAALTALEKGKYTTEPVKTEFGYHVILLEDVRQKEAPAFDEVKERIVQNLQQKAMQAHVAGLLGKAKIE